MRTRPPRGLRDIPTRSSLTSETEHPHRRFLRVASLELRKTLCRKVRDAAAKRAEEMQGKMGEIETEESRLLGPELLLRQGPHDAAGLHSAPGPAPADGRGFTLKY